MRISVDENDTGYGNYITAQANGKRVCVYLNNERVSKCVMADDERGVITRARTDDRGNVVVAADRESIEHITEFGTVRIEFS